MLYLYTNISYQLAGAIYYSFVYFAIAYILYFFIKKTFAKFIRPSLDFIILFFLIFIGTILFFINLFSPVTTRIIINNEYKQLFFSNNLYVLIITITYSIFLFFKLYSIIPKNNKVKLIPFLHDDVLQYIQDLSVHLNIKVPKLYISKTEIVPYTKGLLKKIIVLPTAFLLQLTEQELAAVLLHEIAHIKRLDHYTNTFIIIADVFLSFNPFVYILLKQIKLQRELACDDWVLQQDIRPIHYATALQKVAKLHYQMQYRLALSVSSFELFYRVQRLFKQENKAFFKLSFLPFLSLFILFIGNTNTTIEKINKALVYQPKSKELFVKPILLKSDFAKNLKTVSVITSPTLKQQNNNVQELEVNVLLANNNFIEVAVSNKNILYKTFIKNKTARVQDNIFTFNDSIQIFDQTFNEENINNASQKAIENILQKIATIDSVSLQDNLGLQSEPIKIIITQDGEQNFYYNNLQVNQIGKYNTDTKEWGIQFELTNNGKLIAKRFVLLSVLKKLKSISL